MLLKLFLLERWFQLMFGGFKTVNLTWVKKFAVVGYTWLFFNQRAFSYEERMHVLPGVDISATDAHSLPVTLRSSMSYLRACLSGLKK